MKLVRPVRQTRPMPYMGRTITRPMGLRPAGPAPAPRKLPPQAFRQQQDILLPDIPAGVVLDGQVTHIKSPRPTIEKKYRD